MVQTTPIFNLVFHFDFSYTLVKFRDCICRGCDAVLLTKICRHTEIGTRFDYRSITGHIKMFVATCSGILRTIFLKFHLILVGSTLGVLARLSTPCEAGEVP